MAVVLRDVAATALDVALLPALVVGRGRNYRRVRTKHMIYPRGPVIHGWWREAVAF